MAPPRIPATPTRGFSTSAQRLFKVRTTKPHTLLAADAPRPPPYPYPPPQWYKQQSLGLYGGQTIQFGHNVSEKNKIKTPRQWHPNIQRKWLYSDALARRLRLRVSTRVLRTIDKVGGLDAYLLGGGAARIKELGVWGWQLRWAVLNAERLRPRLEADPALRRMLGLDEDAVMNPQAAREVEELSVVQEGPDAVAAAPAVDVDGFQVTRDEGEYEREIRRHMAEEPNPDLAPPEGVFTRMRRAVTGMFRR